MEQRPERPPEGKLIADAADRLSLSIREAARRAGISYGRWRQIVTGYQNVSPGVYAPVHAPARTLARMAAVVGVAPDQMEDAGRPDAAGIMRQAAPPAPPPRREIDFGGDDKEALAPYRQQVLRELYSALGLGPRFAVGDVPELDAFPGVEETLAMLPANRQPFSTPQHEADAWNSGLMLNERVTLIARMRLLWAQADEAESRRTGLAAEHYPVTSAVPALVSVGGRAARASS